jgi:hypothetical protein
MPQTHTRPPAPRSVVIRCTSIALMFALRKKKLRKFIENLASFFQGNPPACAFASPLSYLLSHAQMLRHALPRLPAALARIIFPRLVSDGAPTAHRPGRVPSVRPPRAWRNITAPGCRCQAPWAEKGCLPVSGGDGDGAMVVTAFAAPSGSRASMRSRRRSRRSPKTRTRLTAELS